MILVNGESATAIDARDRGLAYGDGVFRTLKCRAGVPLWWCDQFDTLRRDCIALALPVPDGDTLRDEVGRVADGADCAVKILVTRGSGVRGYAPPVGNPATRIVMASALPPMAQAGTPTDVTARLCSLRLAAQPRLAGIKHLNRLENVLARAEWNDPGCFEGLLCDAGGQLVGGTQSNLFWLAGNTLCTPPLDDCGITGVTRARLLRRAARLGLGIRYERCQPAAILAADEVLIGNSLIGIRRLARIDDAILSDAGWRTRLDELVHEETD
ncbi:MAG: aminodeoxychorismate lyase [Hydrogenophilales bacterium 16-64-46]|nr:MAG: aminodeoxychorismate lyase [Hydrogenophilales bacterium 12-64-13]OYZ04254.1 MAG: aminodeoxychorismate lyase [Hydrogenophilales bacterium 16-64-46]OZA38538.1 MAG: aminodeoxychorismate lyase [Hydrogenophilales bacterium 17-64-34]HQT00191.1 aminodeoxychorismate lyase [Thiobacillus sp.]